MFRSCLRLYWAERGDHTHTCTEDEILPVVLKLRRSQRRRADEVYRESERRIGQAGDKPFAWQSKDKSLCVERASGHNQVELCRLPSTLSVVAKAKMPRCESLVTLSSGNDGSVRTLPLA